jgi:hypothetical protein
MLISHVTTISVDPPTTPSPKLKAKEYPDRRSAVGNSGAKVAGATPQRTAIIAASSI